MRRTRILLVDDNADIRETLREIIEENPAWKICGEAEEGRSAVTLARQLRPDIIILDYHMPELDGVEAARRILRFARKTPIVFFTAEISSQVTREVLRMGVRCVITKGGGGYLELLNWIEKCCNQGAQSSRSRLCKRKQARRRSRNSRAR
jgi:two-component system, NarL family, response regulator NreC